MNILYCVPSSEVVVLEVAWGALEYSIGTLEILKDVVERRLNLDRDGKVKLGIA